jgi:hypothetical protein
VNYAIASTASATPMLKLRYECNVKLQIELRATYSSDFTKVATGGSTTSTAALE